MQFSLIPLLILTFSASMGLGASPHCGSAEITPAATCADSKVIFHFDNCSLKSSPKPATGISCDGENLRARFASGEHRYEAVFTETKDEWGEKRWKNPGSLTELPVAATESVVHAKAKIVPRPARLAGSKAKSNPNSNSNSSTLANDATVPTFVPLFATPEQRAPASMPKPPVAEKPSPDPANPWKFSGFVDLRLSTYGTKDRTDLPAGNPESGFGLEDSAVFANYEKNAFSLTAELPFRRAKQSDSYPPAARSTNVVTSPPTPGTTEGNTSQTSTIVVGFDKAQLFGKYKFDDSSALTFGQFATFFGLEVNDSKDRVFGKTGLVYDQLLPVTHTGVMVEYNIAGASAKAFAANPGNRGTLGYAANGYSNYEYGAAVGYANDFLHGQIGYMSAGINRAQPDSGSGSRTLTDVLLGTTYGPFGLDFEYAVLDDVSKNTLTPLDDGDKELAGTGFITLATYKVSDAWLLGLRYETTRNDPASGGTFNDASSYGASVHYRFNAQVEGRVEYTSYDLKNVDDVKWKANRFNIASVVTF